jgi:putative tryptophan/tyrosine transport system substrate-binding protein
VKRREFITLIGGAAAAAWPLSARAQQPAMPVIGFIDSGSPAAFAGRLTKFRAGLGEGGYIEGRNVVIEYRWAEGHYEHLPALADDLVRRQVSVITATGSPNAAKAAQAVTSSIPIVFANGGDPVKLGLVASLNRPTGNATGVSFYNSALVGKRLEVLHELVPTARVLGFIANPDNPNTVSDLTDAQIAARALGLDIAVERAKSEAEFAPAFAKLIGNRVDAIVVNNDAFFSSRYDQLVAIAAEYRIPTMYYLRSFVAAGGLISYGTDVEDMYRQAGVYTARILNGVKPADLPVMLPTKFQFIVNLKTAKTLGLTVPLTLQASADEVIE